MHDWQRQRSPSRNGGTNGKGPILGRRFALTCFAAGLLLAAVAAPGAFAAKPTIERITFDETTDDAFLTEMCGFPVKTRAQGHIAFRGFDRERGVVEVFTLNVGLTAMANGKTYRFRDVGANVVRVTPDGDEIVLIIGQAPFAFTGVLKINRTTGEVIHEPQHSTEADVEEACAALSA